MLLRAALVPPAEALEELLGATRALRMLPGVTAPRPDQLDIPVTSFGNLLPADCERLARTLRTAFEGAEAPVVRFQGVRLDQGEITAQLAGDVEPLTDLARFVPEAAETLRLYVDRRRFRPSITVATVDPATSPGLLDGALSSVADWVGTPWSVPGLSLIRTRWSAGEGSPEEFDLIALD